MNRAYKLVFGVLLLIGIIFFINMCQFAKGVKENAVKKQHKVTKDSIKIGDGTYLYLKEIK